MHFQKQTKYKEVPATAIDLFKECHRSSKNGFSDSVKNIIVSYIFLLLHFINATYLHANGK